MTIFLKPKTRYITLGSGRNLTLQHVIEGKGIFQGDVEITIISGSIIDSVTTIPALVTGDLKRYRTVTLINYGQILGKSGNANSGSGGHAFTATSDISIDNRYAFRSGGGGGGKGGTGGNGNYTSYGAWRNSYGTPRNRWDQKENSANIELWWDNVMFFRDINYGWKPAGQVPTQYVAPYTYQRAANARWENRFYDIRRGSTAISYGTAGGSGGRGTGTGLAWQNGLYGNVPVNFAGRGGRGGRGAWWGGKGYTGATGAAGTNSVGGGTNPGSAGTAGGNPGWALFAFSSAFITMKNTGVINGPTHYNGVQPTEHNENLPILIED